MGFVQATVYCILKGRLLRLGFIGSNADIIQHKLPTVTCQNNSMYYLEQAIAQKLTFGSKNQMQLKWTVCIEQLLAVTSNYFQYIFVIRFIKLEFESVDKQHIIQSSYAQVLLSLKHFSREKMIDADVASPIQETSELTFMKSKYPNLKQKLGQPFPYFYHPSIKDDQFYNMKLTQFKAKLQQPEHNFNEQFALFQSLALGRIEGMPGMMTPWQQLSKVFEYDKKDYWVQFLKDKASVKNYGLPKQKQYSIWEVKDIELLKDVYNVDEIKKQRKIIKQFSNYYKACCKFVQKFDKLERQEQIAQIYEQYKKVEQQQSKMNKINWSEKPKINKIAGPSVSIQNEPKVISEKNQNESQERKVQNIQVQSNRNLEDNALENIKPNEEDKKIQPKTPKATEQGKNSKKKTQPKQPGSNKKQVKSAKDKIMSKNMSLDLFFKKKQPEQSEVKPKQNQMVDQQKVDKTDMFIQSLGFNQTNQNTQSIQELKNQFASKRKTIQNQIKACYASIYMTRSRLQLTDFPVKQVKVDFIEPYSEKQNIRYDDSSDEYSELVADSINEEMVQEEEEEEDESESNSAIVSDSFCEYKSSHVFSSSESEEEEQGQKMKPQMTKPTGKWFFSIKQMDKMERSSKYVMVCLIDDTMPMIVKEQAEENSNEVSSAQKVEMYKQIHGSYTPKQVLIKKVNSIVENKISMNKLSTVIKDICQKKGTQRVIKTEMIRQLAQQLAETYPTLEAELEQLRSERQSTRNQEAEAKREQKMNERDQKIEKLILEYNGLMTTALILEYLRNNEMKLVKQQLNNIIKNKPGQKWDEIRSEIKKNKLVKQGRPKKIKQPKDKQQNLKNTHRPIDQILKQNQIEIMNKPKKEKKKKQEGQMLNQADNELQVQEEEEQCHEPSDDESFDLKNKPSKKSKSKKKSIVKIAPLLPPVRRNPKRNKKKSKRYTTMEDVEEPKKSNDHQNEQQVDDCVEQLVQQENVDVEDPNNENKNQKEEQVNKNNSEGQALEDQNPIKNNESIENNPQAAVTPIKFSKQGTKSQEENIEKTANKECSAENIQEI